MTSLLLLGFLLGMRHALEADHLAAVASLATRSRSLRHTVAQGAAWGTAWRARPRCCCSPSPPFRRAGWATEVTCVWLFQVESSSSAKRLRTWGEDEQAMEEIAGYDFAGPEARLQ